MTDSRRPIVDDPASIARLEARIRDLERELAGRARGPATGPAATPAAAARDDEERRESERRLEHGRRLEALGALAGGVAHDFNNLLTSVLGNTDLALAHLPPSSPVRAHLKHIEYAARRAAELTRQMLACSGRGQFLVRPLGIGDLVRGKLPLIRALCPARATVDAVIADGLPLIDGDADQVSQVLMHVVTNACEALGEHPGTVRIVADVCVCTRAELARTYLDEQLPAGRYVYLEVSDTGAGMTPDVVARMFEPFFTTKFTGRGLGLAAALGILRGHRGAVRVTSEPGRGTTIRLLLPARSIPPEEVAAMPGSQGTETGTGTAQDAGRLSATDSSGVGATGQASVTGHVGTAGRATVAGSASTTDHTSAGRVADAAAAGARDDGATAGTTVKRGVLVIDDEETVRGVAKTILERAGYLVFTAANGLEGVARFTELADDIGVVLLDMKLPIMSSRQVCAELRRVRPDVRIVLSSGYLEEDAWPSSDDEPNPYAGFLAKPYRFEELMTCVQRVMSGERWDGGS